MARSNGHCMTMGTASTMASMAEALGMQLPYSATWPAVDARRYETAQRAGPAIVDLVARTCARGDHDEGCVRERDPGQRGDRRLHKRGHPPAGDAGRLGVPLALDDFDVLARDVPTLVNLQPNGTYLMEDFCYAGGLPAVMRELGAGLLHAEAMTVTRAVIGRTCRRPVLEPRGDQDHGRAAPARRNRDRRAARQPRPGRRGHQAVRVLAAPAQAPRPCAGLRLPRGLLPGVNDADLEADEDTVLVIRYCGPQGYPGMPEVANVALPGSCCCAGSATWYGSTTAGCPAPPTGRWCCTPHRKPPRRPAGAGPHR